MLITTLRALTRARAALILLCLGCALLSGSAAGQPDFTFVQVSDLHFPHSITDATLADLVGIGEIELSPYHVTACRPSFVIVTGDMTEFGPKNGAWDACSKAMDALGLPWYQVLGNHDMTWRALSHEVSVVQGREYYSWNNFGCHFVVLRSAAIHDPRPAIEPQQLEWLRRDLAAVGPDVPVFVALHHPLDTKEYSSLYETDRLAEVLRPYNIAAILVGHSHSIMLKSFHGMDMIRGGSTWGPCTPGCMVYSVVNGTLRVAYRPKGRNEATIPLVEKPLRRQAKPAFAVEMLSPDPDACLANELAVAACVNGAEVVSSAADVDGSLGTDLKPSDNGVFEGRIPLADLPAGVHYVRTTATLRDGLSISASRSFKIVRDMPKVQWAVNMRAASKSAPAVSDRAVYVGANDGWMRAYDRKSGELLWRFKTGGAITADPLLLDGRLYFGSEDTNFYCVTADYGQRVWQFEAGAPVYSSATADGKSVYVGCCSGALYCLDAASGNLNWVNRAATYTIESKPYVTGGRVYYGAWDTFVYCVNASDGKLVWKCVGQGSSDGPAAAYFSPADCGPVVCGGKVFIADRKYKLSIIDADSGKIVHYLSGISGVSLSADGKSVYARRLDGRLDKMNESGDAAWSTACQMDDVPTAPREVGGVVYVASRYGLVSALNASDGNVIWQYQATLRSYVYSAVSASDGTAYVSAMDGSLTAIRE